ncbi:MAG TPA: hypothetical protein VGF99_10115 [Myxococcota bacterium]
MSREKVALSALFGLTPVAPEAGTFALTAGTSAAVVKRLVCAAPTLPAASA